ncbi:hypothetical protein ACFOYZ_13630, partial [Neobacillus cucumis]|uniref:hypothetical protein n=1 Tax=Neobacillus cucumis TaxID=1740721 RepID=UPI0036170A67
MAIGSFSRGNGSFRAAIGRFSPLIGSFQAGIGSFFGIIGFFTIYTPIILSSKSQACHLDHTIRWRLDHFQWGWLISPGIGRFPP